MAKGFKVKTVAPKVKAPEWDIDAIKARMTVSYTHLRAHET